MVLIRAADVLQIPVRDVTSLYIGLGSNVPLQIPVLIRVRGKKVYSVQSAQMSNLISIPHQQKIAPEPGLNTIHLALLNVRSLAGKLFLINDLICDFKLDFMFLMETWLSQSNCAAVLMETAPPNFNSNLLLQFWCLMLPS